MEDDVQSWRHHYIPEFYLKGFTEEGGELYVYNKKYNRFYKKGPGGVFYDPHRNTGVLVHPETGEVHKSDLAERMLAHFDNQMATAFEEIRTSKPEDNIIANKVLLYEIRMLIHSVFWRSPVNDSIRNKLIDQESFADLGFGFFDEAGIRHVETEEFFKTIDLWRKAYPALLMISSFVSKYKKLNDEIWGLYYLPDRYHITTDNPIILKEYLDPSSLGEELLFPVSKNILAISTKKYKTHILPSLFSVKVDLLLFYLADVYVAGPDKEYLEFLVQEVKKHSERPNWDQSLKEDIFNYFY